MVNRRERRARESEARKAAKRSAVTGATAIAGFYQAERIAAIPLALGRLSGNAQSAAARVGALMDRELEGAFRKRPVCKRGCWYCCTVHVDASIPEIANLISYARDHFAPDRFEAFVDRARANAAAAKGKTVLQYPAQRCALLDESGECGAYPARPFACRTEHVLDTAETCRLAYETLEDLPAERDEGVRSLSTLMRAGLEYALQRSGFDTSSYELHQALSTCLDCPQALERWANGEDVFREAREGSGVLPYVLPLVLGD